MKKISFNPSFIVGFTANAPDKKRPCLKHYEAFMTKPNEAKQGGYKWCDQLL